MQGGGGWVPPEAAAAAVEQATRFSSWACTTCTLINAPEVLTPACCCTPPADRSLLVCIGKRDSSDQEAALLHLLHVCEPEHMLPSVDSQLLHVQQK